MASGGDDDDDHDHDEDEDEEDDDDDDGDDDDDDEVTDATVEIRYSGVDDVYRTKSFSCQNRERVGWGISSGIISSQPSMASGD
jgi:hypothetical protein